MRTVMESYFAFEACCQHPYAFTSFIYGHYPEILAMDGCEKVATDQVSLQQFGIAREERVLDADLQHQLLALSMMSTMTPGSRLLFVDEAVPVFGPFNRVSNMIKRSARGQLPKPGDPESGDGGALLRVLEDGGVASLETKTKQDLQLIYKECFEENMRGISM